MPISLFDNKSIRLEYYWRTPNLSIPYYIWDNYAKAFKATDMKPFDPYYELFLGKIMNPEIDAMGNVQVPGLGYLAGNNINRFRDIELPRINHRQTLKSSKVHEPGLDFSCTPMVLDQPGSGVFGHILIDLIPKILLAQRILDCDKFPLILRRSNYSRVLPLLDYFEIDPSRLVDIDHELYKLKELRLVSSFLQGVNSRFQFKDLLPFTHLGELRRSRRVWLSRSHLPENSRLTRLLTNREEIEEIVQNLGFELIYPEEKSIGELAEIIRETKILGGESGSALHNILLCHSVGLNLFAVSGKQDFINQVACSALAGANFFGFLGETEQDSGDYSVNPLQFKSALQSILLRS